MKQIRNNVRRTGKRRDRWRAVVASVIAFLGSVAGPGPLGAEPSLAPGEKRAEGEAEGRPGLIQRFLDRAEAGSLHRMEFRDELRGGAASFPEEGGTVAPILSLALPGEVPQPPDPGPVEKWEVPRIVEPGLPGLGEASLAVEPASRPAAPTGLTPGDLENEVEPPAPESGAPAPPAVPKAEVSQADEISQPAETMTAGGDGLLDLPVRGLVESSEEWRAIMRTMIAQGRELERVETAQTIPEPVQGSRSRPSASIEVLSSPARKDSGAEGFEGQPAPGTIRIIRPR